MGEEVIKIIILTLMFYLPYCFLHGKIAQNLAQAKGWKDKRLANIFKGEWHTYGLLVRIVYHISLIYLITGFAWAVETLHISITTIIIGIAIYSPVLDWARGLKPFKINATCEKWEGSFDWDCITIWIRDRLKINTKIASIIIAVIVIVLMILL